MRLFEGADVTNNGRGVMIYNHNRLSDVDNFVRIFQDPVVTQKAEQILIHVFGGSAGFTTWVSSPRMENELILKPRKRYIVELETTEENALVGVVFSFYSV
jgi:hypothetical protein